MTTGQVRTSAAAGRPAPGSVAVVTSDRAGTRAHAAGGTPTAGPRPAGGYQVLPAGQCAR
jgi:hypothetical protein